ncbi:MAG: N-acetylglucosamine-6-phosphate deacetylase [bacterium]|nr:N-acetylglucosamine-6-phosphate deacetylase [bacterium]
MPIMLTLINGRIITPLKEIENGRLLIKDGKIQEIGQAEKIPLPEETAVFDAGGKIICPGFIDLHLHGARGCDFTESEDPDSIRKIVDFHLAHGTTSFLPTLISLPEQKLRSILEHLPAAWMSAGYASSFLGIHLEGPFLNAVYRGVHNEHYLCTPSVEKVKSLLNYSAGTVKMITLAPELPYSKEVIRWLAQHQVVVSIGHSNATYLEVEQAVREGLRHVTHTFNALRGLHQREPAATGAALDMESLSADIIADGQHVHPMLMRLLWRQKGDGGVILITDASPVVGLPPGEYQLWGRAVRVDGDRVLTSDSEQLAGSVVTLDKAIHIFQAATGCSLRQAIRLATLNPATLLGLESRKGLLAAGRDADLVIMDEQSLRVEMVMVGGKFLKR